MFDTNHIVIAMKCKLIQIEKKKKNTFVYGTFEVYWSLVAINSAFIERFNGNLDNASSSLKPYTLYTESKMLPTVKHGFFKTINLQMI